MKVVRPSWVRSSRNPPPPRLPATGWTTASAKPVATAASTALPPARRISRPASEARWCTLTTMPCCARTGCSPRHSSEPPGFCAAATEMIRMIARESRKGRRAMPPSINEPHLPIDRAPARPRPHSPPLAQAFDESTIDDALSLTPTAQHSFSQPPVTADTSVSRETSTYSIQVPRNR